MNVFNDILRIYTYAIDYNVTSFYKFKFACLQERVDYIGRRIVEFTWSTGWKHEKSNIYQWNAHIHVHIFVLNIDTDVFHQCVFCMYEAHALESYRSISW